jgi:ATP-dependent Clp protease ATP-binding subunit ClpC
MVDLMMGRVAKALKNKDMTIELSDAARDLLGQRGFDPVLGARPLRRTIQREIEDQLSERILFDEIKAGQHVLVGVETEKGAEGSAETKKFTFEGVEKPSLVPDVVPVGLVKGIESA